MMTSYSPLPAKYTHTHMHRLPSIFHTHPQIVFYTQCGQRPSSVHEERAGSKSASCTPGWQSQPRKTAITITLSSGETSLTVPASTADLPQAHENMMTVPCIWKIKPPDTGGVFKSFWHSLGPHLTCQLARCLCQSTVWENVKESHKNAMYG